MIKDLLKNLNVYSDLSPSIQKGLLFLKQQNLFAMKPGSYEIEGRDIYVNIDEYETRISDRIEAHKKYIDIQYIVEGEEYIGVTPLENLTVIEEYNPEKDIIFYTGTTEKILLKKGEFVIFYPQDAHLPCQVVNTPQKVKKAVVKIKI